MRGANWDPERLGPVMARGGCDPNPVARRNRCDTRFGADAFCRGRSLTRKPGRRAVQQLNDALVTYPEPTGKPAKAGVRNDLFEIWALMFVIIWHIKPAEDAVLSASMHAGRAVDFAAQPSICHLCKVVFPGLRISSATALVALVYLFHLKAVATDLHHGWADVKDDELATIVLLLADIWVNDYNYAAASYTNFTGIPLERILGLKKRALYALGFNLCVPADMFAAFKVMVDRDLEAFQLERGAFVDALVASRAANPKRPQSSRRDSGCSFDSTVPSPSPDRETSRAAAGGDVLHDEGQGGGQKQAVQNLHAPQRISYEPEVFSKIREHQARLQHEQHDRGNGLQNRTAFAEQFDTKHRPRSETGRPEVFLRGTHDLHRHCPGVIAVNGPQAAPDRPGSFPHGPRRTWNDELKPAAGPVPHDPGSHANGRELDAAVPGARDASAPRGEFTTTRQPAASAARAGAAFDDKSAPQRRHVSEDQVWLSTTGLTYMTPVDVGRAVAAATRGNCHQHQAQPFHQFAAFAVYPWSTGAGIHINGKFVSYSLPWLYNTW